MVAGTKARTKAPATAGSNLVQGSKSAKIFQADERSEIEQVFDKAGLPGWLGWGTYGAESSYGKAANSGHGFGLIGSSYFGHVPKGSDPVYNAGVAAAAYKGYLAEGMDLPEAIEHFSGGEYTEAHVFELGGEKGSGFLAQHGGKDTEGTLGEPGIGGIGGLTNPLDTVASLIKILTSGETWIRLGEVIAGGLLLLLALKALTGTELPAIMPV